MSDPKLKYEVLMLSVENPPERIEAWGETPEVAAAEAVREYLDEDDAGEDVHDGWVSCETYTAPAGYKVGVVAVPLNVFDEHGEKSALPGV